MPVGNCTDDDVTYTVDRPGGDTPLQRKCFRKETRLGTGRTVRFFIGEDLKDEIEIPSEDVVVLLHKNADTYRAEYIQRHPGSQ